MQKYDKVDLLKLLGIYMIDNRKKYEINLQNFSSTLKHYTCYGFI